MDDTYGVNSNLFLMIPLRSVYDCPTIYPFLITPHVGEQSSSCNNRLFSDRFLTLDTRDLSYRCKVTKKMSFPLVFPHFSLKIHTF